MLIMFVSTLKVLEMLLSENNLPLISLVCIAISDCIFFPFYTRDACKAKCDNQVDQSLQ